MTIVLDQVEKEMEKMVDEGQIVFERREKI